MRAAHLPQRRHPFHLKHLKPTLLKFLKVATGAAKFAEFPSATGPARHRILTSVHKPYGQASQSYVGPKVSAGRNRRNHASYRFDFEMLRAEFRDRHRSERD